ncbi:MAG: hypothetical protein OEZ38_08075 [Gammaproteobacteria bacterium]|nr:hypothetical protein [Gammaproteobacteria bacterium]
MTQNILQPASDSVPEFIQIPALRRFGRRFEIMLPRLLQRPFDLRWPGIQDHHNSIKKAPAIH